MGWSLRVHDVGRLVVCTGVLGLTGPTSVKTLNPKQCQEGPAHKRGAGAGKLRFLTLGLGPRFRV